MATGKKNRTLEIFFRGIRGEDLSPARLAADFGVSTKSISRNMSEIKEFLAEHRELVGHSEMIYSNKNKVYRLCIDEFLSDKELFAIAKVIIGSRAFSEKDTSLIISKLKRFVSTGDRHKLNEIVRNELYHFSEIKHDCNNVTENLWALINAIIDKKEITLSYYKADLTLNEKKVQPISLMFSEYYFYLIAYYPDQYEEPRYFRVDRIKSIIEHRKHFTTGVVPDYEEGKLRNRSQFMFYGKLRKVRFWYNGPSVQAIIDKLPTAKIIERNGKTYLLEAEVYGDGIKMFLFSQGTWVKVVAPEEFVEEIRNTTKEIADLYK